MYTSEVVDLLQKLYEWSVVDPHNIDDEKYLFAKKFSEVCTHIQNFTSYIDFGVVDIKSRCVHRVENLSYTRQL